MIRWFTNHSQGRKPSSGSKVLPTATPKRPRATPKRPRATNGPNIFAEGHKAKIAEEMAEQQRREGGDTKQVNLIRYRKIKHKLYDKLTDEEQLAYEGKAAEQNAARKALPEKSEIFT